MTRETVTAVGGPRERMGAEAAHHVANREDARFVPDEIPDSILVACALSGDRATQNALVERYYSDCWRYAYHLLGDHTDADDAVQETFLRAMRGLRRYREEGRFRPWLFTILINQCRNLAISRRRRHRRFGALADDRHPDAPASPSREPDDELLARALQALAPEQREAVLLRYGEGMGYAEMSRLTGAGESALKMRAKRGCARMRSFLKRVDR